MNTNILATAAKLSDVALLERLEALAGRAREATAELIAYLSELQIRKAHRREGPGSLFEYCTQVLRLSQAAAFNRLAAASAARKYPLILDLLVDGSINLTTVRVLAPHLTAENHRAAFQEAIGRTKSRTSSSIMSTRTPAAGKSRWTTSRCAVEPTTITSRRCSSVPSTLRWSARRRRPMK